MRSWYGTGAEAPSSVKCVTGNDSNPEAMAAFNRSGERALKRTTFNQEFERRSRAANPSLGASSTAISFQRNRRRRDDIRAPNRQCYDQISADT
jgi:hypothetical protein